MNHEGPGKEMPVRGYEDVKAPLQAMNETEHAVDPEVSLIGSFPVPTCRFAKAYRCRRPTEESAFGYDEMNEQIFYRLRAHLRLCWPGVFCGVDFVPANVHDLPLAEELLEDLSGHAGWCKSGEGSRR